MTAGGAYPRLPAGITHATVSVTRKRGSGVSWRLHRLGCPHVTRSWRAANPGTHIRFRTAEEAADLVRGFADPPGGPAPGGPSCENPLLDCRTCQAFQSAGAAPGSAPFWQA